MAGSLRPRISNTLVSKNPGDEVPRGAGERLALQRGRSNGAGAGLTPSIIRRKVTNNTRKPFERFPSVYRGWGEIKEQILDGFGGGDRGGTTLKPK